jgi:hypothetical protein
MFGMQKCSSNRISVKVENLFEFLRANPNLGAESKDDRKCEPFLRQLGILELFRRASSPNLSVGTIRDHQTHWIVDMLWSGYPNLDGNGYRVICLPKSKVPEAGVRQFVQCVMDDYGGYGQEDYEITLGWDSRNHG